MGAVESQSEIPDCKMDIFGDDFSSSAPATATMESSPALSLVPQMGDVEDNKQESVPDFGLGLEPLKEDPAESFITKEKEQLDGLGLDLGIGEPVASVAQENVAGGLFVDSASFGDVQEQKREMEPEIEDVVDEDNPEMTIPKIEEDSQNDLGNITLISSRPRDSNIEPPCLVEWRKKQDERIKTKDEEEARRKQELREKARQELEAWYRKYDEEVRIKKEENRVSEEAFLADVHGLKPGTEWERVARNCGFYSKVVHCEKDRARMRNVILSLKQQTLLNRN